MKIVLDTNVLVSGIFFGGVPGEILETWSSGRFTLALSPSIIDEYRRVGAVLEERHGDLGFSELLTIIVGNSDIVNVVDDEVGVSRDPADDKFLACASSAGAEIIVSGDEDLLSIGSWKDVRILSPREFLDAHLSNGRS